MIDFALRSGVETLLSRTLDVLLPPACLKCRAAVDKQGALCATCWRSLHFLEAPLCSKCGVPLESVTPSDRECGACIADPPLFSRARAALAYDDESRSLITLFKYADRTDLADSFASWMARAGQDLIAECDILTPVPLHRWRLLMRRFNQAGMLAHAIGRRAGRRVIPDLLIRTRPTPPQVGLSFEGRRRNVAQAFRLRDRYVSAIIGARVLLIDDVLTTGATVEACAKLLSRAGAAQVDVVTLARVVAPRRVRV